ncbi:MAG: hypothetical protein F6J97_20150 [Leptolyngbya sp. SIO4C1]|nr:hypothetical protein [Leptolyngbya sp. SIO4C1]
MQRGNQIFLWTFGLGGAIAPLNEPSIAIAIYRTNPQTLPRAMAYLAERYINPLTDFGFKRLFCLRFIPSVS